MSVFLRTASIASILHRPRFFVTSTVHTASVALTVSGNGRVIAARSSKRTISFYDTEDAELVTVLTSEPNSLITDFVVNPTNNALVLLVAREIPSDDVFFVLQEARSVGELWRGQDGSEIANLLMAK